MNACSAALGGGALLLWSSDFNIKEPGSEVAMGGRVIHTDAA